jgi:hypothetical protein
MLTEAGLLMGLGSIMMFICLAFYSFQFLVETHLWGLVIVTVKDKAQNANHQYICTN